MCKNIIFVACVLATFVALWLNIHSMYIMDETFDSAFNESAKTQRVMVAQEYAMSLAFVAEHEAQRSHELDQALGFAKSRLYLLNFEVNMYRSENEEQLKYIKVLKEFIRSNNLPVPAEG